MWDGNADDADFADFHGFKLNKKISDNPYNSRHPRYYNPTLFINNEFIRHHFIAFWQWVNINAIRQIIGIEL